VGGTAGDYREAAAVEKLLEKHALFRRVSARFAQRCHSSFCCRRRLRQQFPKRGRLFMCGQRRFGYSGRRRFPKAARKTARHGKMGTIVYMDPDPIERSNRIPPEERLNVFALVIYIPAPLGRFLDDLRRELVPGCNPHAHVSVLPPRPLAVEWQVAYRQTRALTDGWAPFEIELAGIEMFPVTDVVYIDVGAGAKELGRMHVAMNSGALQFHEPFPYSPHITLAQEIPREQVAATNELARRRWEEYRGTRRFLAERAEFVQNTLANCWLDLAEYRLGGSPVKS
jgi:2'-5' RNA ligase